MPQLIPSMKLMGEKFRELCASPVPDLPTNERQADAFLKYASELEELSNAIREDNQTREVPFDGFDPRYLEVSVSL